MCSAAALAATATIVDRHWPVLKGGLAPIHTVLLRQSICLKGLRAQHIWAGHFASWPPREGGLPWRSHDAC